MNEDRYLDDLKTVPDEHKSKSNKIKPNLHRIGSLHRLEASVSCSDFPRRTTAKVISAEEANKLYNLPIKNGSVLVSVSNPDLYGYMYEGEIWSQKYDVDYDYERGY